MKKEGFKIQKLTDFGSSEDWVARLYLSLPDFVDKLLISSEAKQEFGYLLNDVFRSLSYSFMSLRRIRNFKIMPDIPMLSQESEYINFYNHLWTAFKDRFPKILLILGFDIGFLYQNNKNFKKGLELFNKINSMLPDEFTIMISNDKEWLDKLSSFRNKYIQHKSVSDKIKTDFFNIQSAEAYFFNIWTSIENISIMLMSLKLPDFACFMEIENNKIDKKCPRRFEIVYKR